MKRLANIDIAQTRHHTLIEQQGLGRLFAPLKGRDQDACVKVRSERLRSHGGKPWMLIEPRRLYQPHKAKPPRVRIGHGGTGLGHEQHMGMFGIRGRRMDKITGPLSRATGLINLKAASHAQMHDQGIAPVQSR